MSSILIIDDEEAIAWSLRKAFSKAGHTVAVAASAEDGLQKAATHPPDVVFLDVRLPGQDGLSALAQLRTRYPRTAVVIMTAHGDLGTAVRAVEGGAVDYLAKPFDLTDCLALVARLVTPPKPSAPEPPLRSTTTDQLLGRSAAMQAVFKRIALVAPTEASVLVTGESGTGKELVARAVHDNSRRKASPFVPVHIAALNPNLVESELFGHVRGAFTGADRQRDGLLVLANGGTVFLDELCDIPLPVQAKLLRVLERREVVPVGGVATQPIDVRVVSATHVDLPRAVAAGSFRHDLYHRLNVYPISLRPLRERPDDIQMLAEHFAHCFHPGGGPLPSETLAVLTARTWPGNVRELRNAIEHAAVSARGGPMTPEHLPPPIGPTDTSIADRLNALVGEWTREVLRTNPETTALYAQLLGLVERPLLATVLEARSGNRLAAARVLGLARGTVRKLLDDNGLHR